MSLTDETFSLVRDHLQTLGYYGPVSLSCDDTKLTPAWKVCKSKDNKSALLVGAIGGPITVTNAAQAQALIDEGSHNLATKVSIYSSIKCHK